MSGLRGDTSSLKGFGTQLTKISAVLAQSVARDAAPALTKETAGAYDSGRTAYGEARPRSESGDPLSLVRTGAVRGGVRFAVIGTVVRCVLPESYAKYLIGKYSILPNGVLPVAWGAKLRSIAQLHFGASLPTIGGRA